MAILVDQILMNESGRISPEIYRKTINSSPWLKLVTQGAWENQMGSEVNVMMYERTLPATALTWSAVGFNTGAANSCVPDAAVITPAQTLRSYGLKQVALESAPLCVNDVRFSLQFTEQLNNVYDNLTRNTKYAWQDRYRDEYTRLAEHKVIAHYGQPEGSASFPLQVPTSRLTQGILDYWYLRIIRELNDDESLGMVMGRPQLALITSAETSDNIIKVNDDIRTDFRYAFQGNGAPNPLLRPLGVDFAYRGFYHIIDLFPARWEFTGGAWVRVDPYTPEATTNGTRYVTNSSYLNATYEDSVIFLPNMFKSLVPNTITSPGGNVQFDPVQYRGEFRWLNIPHRTENPFGTTGWFRGEMQSASKPVHPEVGVVIRHLRCNPTLSLTTCS